MHQIARPERDPARAIDKLGRDSDVEILAVVGLVVEGVERDAEIAQFDGVDMAVLRGGRCCRSGEVCEGK